MPGEKRQLFLISRIAKMLDIHPQTLRLYERAGFIKPARSKGNTRLYSWEDVEQIRLVLHLTRDLGVNLAGVEVILRVRRELEQLQQEVEELRRQLIAALQQDAASVPPSRALVLATQRALAKAL
ncbi:MAG: MerR family transcriptional regulator [Candidatus Tectimicrobiota bacterium]|nr:MAG: MerR family transcriptional regulator [Candidatus Tectomicrobia bacterium]